jgi:hypothetical protein
MSDWHLGADSGISHVPAAALGASDRNWVGNDDSQRNQHGVVALSESPILLSLSWRESKDQPAKAVGTFRLHLDVLLANRLIRVEDERSVRVRFFHDDDGNIYLQSKLSEPRVLVGRT